MPNKRKGSGFNKLGGLRLQSGRRDQVSIDKVGGPITLKWQTVKNQQYSQVLEFFKVGTYLIERK